MFSTRTPMESLRWSVAGREQKVKTVVQPQSAHAGLATFWKQLSALTLVAHRQHSHDAEPHHTTKSLSLVHRGTLNNNSVLVRIAVSRTKTAAKISALPS